MTPWLSPSRIIFLIAAAVVITGCSKETRPNETGTNDWHPNIACLEKAAKYGDPVMRDAASTLAHDVRRFYQLLRDKQWRETYELRAKAFREDVPESVYLAEGRNAEKLWGLSNYDVLSSEFHSSEDSTNANEAILICKFTELPDYAVSYSTVFWHKEEGVWKCLSAGPVKLGIFRATRPPMIDWR